jgi:hypothetical protein
MTDLDRPKKTLRRVEDGPVKRPYLSLIRNRTTWSDLRFADGEQYTVGERVDAVELTPEVRTVLAATGAAGDTGRADRERQNVSTVAISSGVGCARCGCQPCAALDILCTSCRQHVESKEGT